MSVVCDIDGVVYRGDALVPGSDLALRRLLEAGVDVWFATNNSTRSPESIAAKIERVTGVAVPPRRVATSSQAAALLLQGVGGPVMVLGGEGIHAALAEAGIPATEVPEEAAALIVGLDRDLTYPRLARAADAVRHGARFIATNTDATFPIAGGLLPGGGAMVAAIQATTGVVPEVAGKPHPPMRALLRSRGVGPAWVVGDRVETDVALAAEEPGWRSILVLSGVTGGAEASGADHVVADLAAAVDLVLSGA